MPAPTVVDPVAKIVSALLSCVVEKLELYQVPVCRSFWYPGAIGTWDACETTSGGAEGQAWVAVQRIHQTANFPADQTDANRIEPYSYAARMQVGVLRCAHTVDDSGRPPHPEQITEDAIKVSQDRAIVEQAILCCFVDGDLDPGGFHLSEWVPLGPNGGCVGGAQSLSVMVPYCGCQEVS